MRRDEEFVGRSLVEFFGGRSVVTILDGEDPPDLCMIFIDSCVGVEVTRLLQFTLEPDGTFGNRATQDSFAVRLLDELNDNVGPLIPDGVSFLIGIEMPVPNPPRFRKDLTAWVSETVTSAELGTKREREIEGSRTSIAVIAERPSGKKIVGFVSNKHSSADRGSVLTKPRRQAKTYYSAAASVCPLINQTSIKPARRLLTPRLCPGNPSLYSAAPVAGRLQDAEPDHE